MSKPHAAAVRAAEKAYGLKQNEALTDRDPLIRIIHDAIEEHMESVLVVLVAEKYKERLKSEGYTELVEAGKGVVECHHMAREPRRTPATACLGCEHKLRQALANVKRGKK
jgi:acyl-CoA reductase-like NAD-dependent aldehyde dehydrogenase